MRLDTHLGGAVPAALACVALAAGSAVATPARSVEPQHVNIEASRTITTKQAPAGIQEVAQLSRTVGYGDLDLATAAGARELTSRIQRAAAFVCGQLDELYPAESPARAVFERANCVDDAVDGAMAQAEIAIGSAKERQLR